MSDGCDTKYTKCAICGRMTQCYTFVSGDSYDYIGDDGNPE